MTARDAWIGRLREAAPGADLALLRLVAGLLASRATSDVLFVVFDALVEAAREAGTAGYARAADGLRALAIPVAAEAAQRAPVIAGEVTP
jgi:hypothetical protein